MLTRDSILNATVPTASVKVAEWGGSVTLRALTPKTRVALLDTIYANEDAVAEYQADQMRDPDDRQGLAEVKKLDSSFLHLMSCIVDSDTLQPLFSIDDYDRFLELPSGILNDLYSTLMVLENRPSHAQKKRK